MEWWVWPSFAEPVRTGGVKNSLKDLPGPKGLPFVGTILNPNQLHRSLKRWCDRYGSRYLLRAMGGNYLVLNDPELIQEVLRNRPDNFRRMNRVEPVFRELKVTGLFSVEGQDWRRLRTLTNPAFNTEHLKDFFGTLRLVSERLYRRWKQSSGKSVEIQKDLMRFTVDVTTNLAFGYDLNTLEEKGDVIQTHLEKIFPILGRRISFPFSYWHYFKLPSDREVERSLTALRATVDEIVENCRRRLSDNPILVERPNNFLEALLASDLKGETKLTGDELFGNVLTILIAGEDTTANSMAWLFNDMINHPEVQKQMHEEADRTLGESICVENYKDLERLGYTEAAANESMRINPVAPFLSLEANVDTQLGGLDVPKGTGIVALWWHAAMDDKHFTRASEFKPERWLPSKREEYPVHNLKAFLPFGAGPRFCPGRSLALVQVKNVMAMACRNFVFSRGDSSKEVSDEMTFVMVPRDLSVRIDLRSKR